MKMKETITAGSFIGFVGSLILFIIFSGIPIEFTLENFAFTLLVWILAYAIFMLFGFTKEGMFAFGLSIYRILTDKSSTNEQKFQMMMQSVQTILGMAADLSFLVESEKKEKTDKVDKLPED